MNNKLSLLFIILTAIIISLVISRPGLAHDLFLSPIPPPAGDEAVWCAEIEAAFTPNPGLDEMAFVATLTNTTYITGPPAYPLDMPAERVYVGVWQEQNRHKTDTGYLFLVSAMAFGQAGTINGAFPASSGGSPVHYFLKLWDGVDGDWGREGCEPSPVVIYPPAKEPPPPVRTAPISGAWQATYSDITFVWQAPNLGPGVDPVLDYELEVTWTDGLAQQITTTLTQTTVPLPSSTDQEISWRVRARNEAGYGRWSELGWVYIIDGTAPTLSPIIETQGVISGTWQNEIDRPIFMWFGHDEGSGLAGYRYGWTSSLPCIPATFTTTTTFSSPAAVSGVNHFCVLAEDRVGNGSDIRYFEFRYDPPGVGLDVQPAALTAFPGQVATYTVGLSNASQAADTFTTTVDTGNWPGSRWPAAISLAGQEVDNRDISMTVPLDTRAGTVRTITLTAVSRADPVAGAERQVVVTVNRPDALNVVGVDTLVRRPGEAATYTLVLTNGAAAPVTFDLSTASVWPVNLPASLALDAFGSQAFEVDMPPPVNATSGAVNAATITAAVRDYPEIAVQAVITGVVNRVDILDVAAPAQMANTSGVAGYTLTVTNGSAATDTFDINAVSDGSVSVPEEITVGGGQTKDFVATVILPGGVVNGTIKTSTITLTSRADPAVKLPATLSTTAGRLARLRAILQPVGSSLSITKETPVEVDVVYENNSNYADDLTVSYVLPEGWEGGVSPTTMSLEPLISGTGQLAFTVPQCGVAPGLYTIPITVSGRYEEISTAFDLALTETPECVFLPVIVK